MIEQDPYSEVFRTNNHHLMNLMYSVARVWLGSYVQFPHSSSYNDKKDTKISEDAFMKSYPAIHFIKDTKSDFQVIKPLTWNDFMAGEHLANIKELHQILVDNIKPTPMSMSQSKGN